jgi:hypothetical protein
MDTGRARERSTVARLVLIGAIALVTLFAGAGLESVTVRTERAVAREAMAARDTGANLVAAPSTRAPGHAWFASLIGVVAFALLGASRLRAIRSRDRRGSLRRLSFRLRAPPRLLVAH